MPTNLVQQQLDRLPESPGVYLFKDSEGAILYVGKATNLRSRVRSYFLRNGQILTRKLEHMVERITDIDYIVVGSEQEALIHEMSLIKRHHPRYNVRLRDDKMFPFLKIETDEPWPRIYLTRHPDKSTGRYFGPFASAWSVRQTLKVLQGIFPFRTCTRPIKGVDKRACLEYHMGQCLAPCIGKVTREEYAEVIRQVIFFLEGRQEKIVKELQRRMQEAAAALNYEKAARIRDQIESIRRVIEGQRIATKVRGDQDVIAFASEKDTAYVQVFFIRNSHLSGRESFVMQGALQEEPRCIMADFIKQFYHSAIYVPPLLVLQYTLEDAGVIKEWLKNKRNGNLQLQVPRRGAKKELVDIVAENARQGLERLKMKALSAPQLIETALAELEKELDLPHPPTRIEAYDISNIQGHNAVGSMVVFEDGRPKTAHYRRFQIKTVAGADDCAMLAEVLKRRFKRVADETAADAWAIMPDLVLVDGGKGPRYRCRSVLAERPFPAASGRP